LLLPLSAPALGTLAPGGALVLLALFFLMITTSALVTSGPYGKGVPMKISEMTRLLEQDGWTLKRVTGSHRHCTHPVKPGLVTVAGKPSATLQPKTEASILRQAGLRRDRP